MFTSECGKGETSCYAAIAGGVCFACGGAGKIITKGKPQQGIKFSVSAVEKASGDRLTVFYIKARSEAAALKMAVNKLSSGNAYDPATARVAA